MSGDAGGAGGDGGFPCLHGRDIAPPLPTHYVFARHDRRPQGRLHGRREELVEKLGEARRRVTGPPGEPEGDGAVPDRRR
jgi:hypothetical protein